MKTKIALWIVLFALVFPLYISVRDETKAAFEEGARPANLGYDVLYRTLLVDVFATGLFAKENLYHGRPRTGFEVWFPNCPTWLLVAGRSDEQTRDEFWEHKPRDITPSFHVSWSSSGEWNFWIQTFWWAWSPEFTVFGKHTWDTHVIPCYAYTVRDWIVWDIRK